MTTPSLKQETANSISIVYDADDAGKAAAIDATFLIHDIFDDWGTAQFPSEPESNALATAQRTYSDLKAELHARISLDLPTETIERDLDEVWAYIATLQRTAGLGPTLYSTCKTADDYITAHNAVTLVPRESRGFDYKKVKASIDLPEYISRSTPLVPRGEKWMGKCPLPDHQDDTASFWVYPNQSWYCFGCRRGGDIFHFVKAMNKGLDELG